MSKACETNEGHNILSLAIADLKKKLCDLRNCKANVEEDTIRPSTDFADKEDQLCASITIVPKGIKKREIYHNKKRRTKSWTEKSILLLTGGNLLNYPYFHHSILFLHINIVYYYCC